MPKLPITIEIVKRGIHGITIIKHCKEGFAVVRLSKQVEAFNFDGNGMKFRNYQDEEGILEIASWVDLKTANSRFDKLEKNEK